MTETLQVMVSIGLADESMQTNFVVRIPRPRRPLNRRSDDPLTEVAPFFAHMI